MTDGEFAKLYAAIKEFRKRTRQRKPLVQPKAWVTLADEKGTLANYVRPRRDHVTGRFCRARGRT